MSNSYTMGWRRQGGYTAIFSNGVAIGPRFGTAPLVGAINFTYADAVLGIEQIYQLDFSIPTVTMKSVDLFTGGGELDIINLPVALKQVREIYIELTTPGAATSLRFGPQNVANAWTGKWGAAGATIYDVVSHIYDIDDGYNNWSVVDATHKVFNLYNPGLATVTGTMLVAGTQV